MCSCRMRTEGQCASVFACLHIGAHQAELDVGCVDDRRRFVKSPLSRFGVTSDQSTLAELK